MFYRIDIIAFIFLLFSVQVLTADQKYVKVEDLSDFWKFHLGDNKKWADPEFNDSDWDVVFVPSRWEDEGYNGYDGYAWYRKEFRINSIYLEQTLFLSLGTVDDVAEIYVNGKLVGVSGSFPPKYESAYKTKIWLPLSANILHKNSVNVIAVRVYDGRGEGGISKGDVGLFIFESPLKLLVNLEGRWKFSTGDNFKWKENGFDDSNWQELTVPAMWDAQGYKDYDGFAWYRLKFNINLNNNEFDQGLVLILGKIDDIDETYLNGNLAGSTGDLLVMPFIYAFKTSVNVEYNLLRGYRIDKADLRNGENVLSVRVYDGFRYGGIYEGPIGIAHLEDYLRFRTRDVDIKEKTFFEKLFD